MLSVTLAVGKRVGLTVWTKGEGLGRYGFLLSSGQKETLVCHLSEVSNETDSVIHVITVQKSNVLVRHLQLTVTKCARRVDHLRLLRVKLIIEPRHSFSLSDLA